MHLKNRHAARDLALFSLAIDSTLSGCDLVSVQVRDIVHESQILRRAAVIQRRTQRPVRFELTEPTRWAVAAWLEQARLRGDQYLFPSRAGNSPHVSTCQYARMVHQWVEAAGKQVSSGALPAVGTSRSRCLLI
jgi:integrase